MRRYLFLMTFLHSIICAQNIELRNTENQFDYVIITVDDYISVCEIFKTHKEINNEFDLLITTKDDILAEFNNNISIQSNIREFISFAGKSWADPKPNYFLFAADLDSIPNFSFRSIESEIFENYDTSHSDYYYGVDMSSEDSTHISYSVGRVPARNANELLNYFKKVISYENAPFEDWNHKSLFVSDDEFAGDAFDGDIHLEYCKNLSEQMPEFITAENITAVQSSEYYGNKNSIIEKINEGEAAVFFGGHGHNEVFTHESLFVAEDVDLLTNINKSFFVSIVGAQRFSRKDKSSIVNEMILSENGALASINSVGSHFFTASENYYNEIWRQLFSDITIGEILMNANNKTGNSTEKRKYNLFGDPSIVLKTVQPTGQLFEDELVSESFRLHQNYPNPFNPTTTIKYTLPFGVNSKSSIVKIKIFDLLGREIETLVNEIQKPGNYEIEWNAADKPSGVYFYRLQAGGLSETRKMILSK